MDRPRILLCAHVKSSPTGRARAKDILAREYPLLADSIEVVSEPGGRPILLGIAGHIGISHSRGLLAVYLGPLAAGIDLELIRERGNATEIAEMLFSEAERERCYERGSFSIERFYRAWTAHEAALKRDGLGLFAPLPNPDALERETRHWRVLASDGRAYALCLCAKRDTLETVEITLAEDAGIALKSIMPWEP